MMPNTPSTDPAAVFRGLHESGCFVVPNPWDRGSAILLHQMGFLALATSSAGFGFSEGLPDVIGVMSVERVLEHAGQIVEATPLPVSVDFQDGYATDVKGVATNVRRCVDTGAAGVSIEDATNDVTQPLLARSAAVERIAAARSAIDDSGRPVVLTGRCEAWLVGDETPLETALDRLVAYSEAGADCLYAPGVRDPAHIRAIVEAVRPKPVNVLVGSSAVGLTVGELAELGVRRVSVGSALSRVALGAAIRASRQLLHEGRFESFDGAVSFAELNGIFARSTERP